ncbi:MAG: hypothetical protein ACXADY_27335 [Candidatus Hodarchaeales archaeon]|jgi:hypothetical protein
MRKKVTTTLNIFGREKREVNVSNRKYRDKWLKGVLEENLANAYSYLEQLEKQEFPPTKTIEQIRLRIEAIKVEIEKIEKEAIAKPICPNCGREKYG